MRDWVKRSQHTLKVVGEYNLRFAVTNVSTVDDRNGSPWRCRRIEQRNLEFL